MGFFSLLMQRSLTGEQFELRRPKRENNTSSSIYMMIRDKEIIGKCFGKSFIEFK
jgi:hypothetical protein